MSQEVLVKITIDNFFRIYNLKRQSKSKKKRFHSSLHSGWSCRSTGSRQASRSTRGPTQFPLFLHCLTRCLIPSPQVVEQVLHMDQVIHSPSVVSGQGGFSVHALYWIESPSQFLPSLQSLNRIWRPPGPQVFEHSFQADQSFHLHSGRSSHVWTSTLSPVQSLPRQVLCLCRLAKPQVAEQGVHWDHSSHSPDISSRQSGSEHDSKSLRGPWQEYLNPFWCWFPWHVLVRSRNPCPQVTEHSPQLDHWSHIPTRKNTF